MSDLRGRFGGELDEEMQRYSSSLELDLELSRSVYQVVDASIAHDGDIPQTLSAILDEHGVELRLGPGVNRGVYTALTEGREIEADVVQIFSKNQRQWKAKPYTPEIVEQFKAAMEEHGLLLLVHGEVTRPDVDVFDREARFLDEVLAPLVAAHPRLKVVLEHVTTREGVDFVRQFFDRLHRHQAGLTAALAFGELHRYQLAAAPLRHPNTTPIRLPGRPPRRVRLGKWR